MLRAYEKGYKVNNEGKVYNPRGKELKGYVNPKGYLQIGIRYDKKKGNLDVHRLQAYQKFGDKIFEEGVQVRHLDGNALNNSSNNIELGTAYENTMDKSEETRFNSAVIATRKYQNSIRTFEERCEIYNELSKGTSYKNIINKYNISKSTLSYMKNQSIEYKEYMGM
jgi:uncharacterized protein YerC